MNQNHIYMLIWLTEDTSKFNTFSATRQRTINELIKNNLVSIDENEYVRVTDIGTTVLEITVKSFKACVDVVERIGS